MFKHFNIKIIESHYFKHIINFKISFFRFVNLLYKQMHKKIHNQIYLKQNEKNL